MCSFHLNRKQSSENSPNFGLAIASDTVEIRVKDLVTTVSEANLSPKGVDGRKLAVQKEEIPPTTDYTLRLSFAL